MTADKLQHRCDWKSFWILYQWDSHIRKHQLLCFLIATNKTQEAEDTGILNRVPQKINVWLIAWAGTLLLYRKKKVTLVKLLLSYFSPKEAEVMVLLRKNSSDKVERGRLIDLVKNNRIFIWTWLLFWPRCLVKAMVITTSRGKTSQSDLTRKKHNNE